MGSQFFKKKKIENTKTISDYKKTVFEGENDGVN